MADAEKLPTRVKSVLEDPSAQAVARVYAKAFLDAAASVNVEEALEEFASFLDDVLDKNPEFQSVLCSGMLNRDETLALIDRVVAPYGSDLFTNFLRVLARHDRLGLLPLILGESQRQHLTRTGKQQVYVTTAKPLTDDSLKAIRERLEAVFSFEPVIETQVDSTLLGGIVIRVGSTVYDSSLRARMKQLRNRLSERALHEIQSGRDRFSHPAGD